LIHVANPKMKKSNAIIEIEMTVFLVDNEPDSTVSMFDISRSRLW